MELLIRVEVSTDTTDPKIMRQEVEKEGETEGEKKTKQMKELWNFRCHIRYKTDA